jgi:hypothetical protein
MKLHRHLLPVCLLLFAAGTAGASVKAWLDTDHVGAGESVRLTLEHDGQIRSQPNLEPLSRDFDILQTSSSSNLRIINGRISSGTEISLTLSPKHGGQLVIPSLTWGSDRTSPLTLTVAGDGGGDTNAAATQVAKVFIESELEQKKPLVLSAVHLTMRVYAAVPLLHASLELPTSDAVLVRQLGDDQVSNVEKNSMTYRVVTRRYLLFPQHSGSISLPGATLNAQVEVSSPRTNPYDPFSVFGGMVGNTRPVRLHGDPIGFDVQPRPASVSAPYWLPAREVTLDAQWQPQSLQARVGDPVTVALQLKAQGLTAAQLPDLSALMSIPDGLKAYPEQPKLKDEDRADTVQGSREQTLALIAGQPGRYTIPALHVSWWDTRTSQQREVSVPARSLSILPAVGAAATTGANASAAPAAAPAPGRTTTVAQMPSAASAGRTPAPADSTPWRSISVGLFLLWLATVIAWVWRATHPAARSRTPKVTGLSPEGPRNGAGASAASRAFQQACRQNDALAARRHLLAWAGEVLKPESPAGLGALARTLNDPAVTPLLGELDRACFAGGEEHHWNGAALARVLNVLPAARHTQPRRGEGLASLYP